MSIQDVTSLIKTKLQEDAEWGNSLFWNNLDSIQNDYQTAEELPVTCITAIDSGMSESSTLSDDTTWDFSIKGVFWVGEKVTEEAQFNEYLRLKGTLTDIYNNVVDDLDCGWVTDYLSTSFESIDERMTILGRFSITINTIR